MKITKKFLQLKLKDSQKWEKRLVYNLKNNIGTKKNTEQCIKEQQENIKRIKDMINEKYYLSKNR